MLYLVPTPIGNLGDITLRAIEVLKTVDVILAEDTRTTGKLLAHYDIPTKMQVYHAHNEHKALARIIEQLSSGLNLALVTDAGTPGISDPGFLLVRACHESNLEITCLPGPNAIIPALVISGLPCDRFHFDGFLPRKKGRKTRLEYLSSLDVTIVIYESPHRIVRTLKDIATYFGENRDVALVKEISKVYESVIRGTVKDLLSDINDDKKFKGEFVVVVSKS